MIAYTNFKINLLGNSKILAKSSFEAEIEAIITTLIYMHIIGT